MLLFRKNVNDSNHFIVNQFRIDFRWLKNECRPNKIIQLKIALFCKLKHFKLYYCPNKNVCWITSRRRRVMIIIVGNGHINPNSNPE